ncbi:MAG: 3-deoxy-manno-octulosonate cytidylyltransferase family protein [Sphingomonadales bacterium]
MTSTSGRVVIIIPARYESSRFPAKPLAPLRGSTGEPKPLIQRSWEAARRVPGIDAVYVATDHPAIAEVAAGFGADVLMTSSDCRNGTERCAEAIAQLPDEPDLVVNLQGDAPLTPPHFVTALVDALGERIGTAAVATPCLRCDVAHLEKLREEERHGRVGGTTVVAAPDGRALYFSKRLIPHFPPEAISDDRTPVRLHIGVYAYTPAALEAYRAGRPGVLEQLEGLEQLRFLDIGLPVEVVEVAPPDWEIWELNNPSDTTPIEHALALMGLE